MGTDNDKSNAKADYDTSLLQYLFSLFMFKESRLQACQLVESILLHIPMLNLNRITNLRYILEAIDDDGLSCVCKIFAVTLSNLDTSERKYFGASSSNNSGASPIAATSGSTTTPVSAVAATSRINQQQQSASHLLNSSASTTSDSNNNVIRKPSVSANVAHTSSSSPSPQKATASVVSHHQQQPMSIRDQNQEFLLSIPCLLFRLVNLVRRKDYTIRFSGASSEIENWIR